jgi:hypothetical protein
MNDQTMIPPPPPPPVKKSNRKVWLALVAGVGVTGLFGLAIALASGDDNQPTAQITEPATTEDEPATTVDRTPPAVDEPTTTTTTAAKPDIIEVGQGWYTWDNGLEAQVASVEQFTPDYDSTPTPDIVVTVTIKNGTGQTYEAIGAMVNVYGGPNGVQAEGEYTYYGFDGNIPVGGTATAKWSFTVPPEHLSDLMIEVAPGYDASFDAYDSGFFHGSA